jgi:hypothetical protein
MDNVVHLCFAAAFGRLHSVEMAFHRGQVLSFLVSFALAPGGARVVAYSCSVYVAVQPLMAPDYDGRTMLHVAVCNNHLAVVQYALQHGADVDSEDRFDGRIPIEPLLSTIDPR